MLKKYWKTLFITSIVTLLPMALGLLLWDRLPEQLPSHWNVNGEVDGWSSKAFAVFGMPLILLGVQWLCALATCADPKRKNHMESNHHRKHPHQRKVQRIGTPTEDLYRGFSDQDHEGQRG